VLIGALQVVLLVASFGHGADTSQDQKEPNACEGQTAVGPDQDQLAGKPADDENNTDDDVNIHSSLVSANCFDFQTVDADRVALEPLPHISKRKALNCTGLVGAEGLEPPTFSV
jgi:hypothetical protein